MLTKFSLEDLLSPGKGNLLPMTDSSEGAEDLLIKAVEANKKYATLYKYSDFPQIVQIANDVAGNTNFSSLDFATSVYRYQVNNLGILKENADGQFDPPLITDISKRLGINLADVENQWKQILKGNWLGHRWEGRRNQQTQPGIVQWPMKSAQIIGDFTGAVQSDPNHPKGHWGIDLGNVSEGTPIFPIAPGTVKSVNNDSTGGNNITIDHGKFTSYYAHMSKVNVRKGDTVNINTVIGGVGKTGNARGSVHLHLQVNINGANVDPKTVIGKPYEALELGKNG